MATRIQLRHATAAAAAAENATLALGEFGYETDSRIGKIGDGVTAWNDLDPWPSISLLSGTKAEFNAALTDGDFLFVGDITSGVSDHGLLTGLNDDDHTQYAKLSGRAGGQQIFGGVAAGEFLTLYGTDEASPGTVRIGSNIMLYGPGGTVAGDFYLQCVTDDIGTIYGDPSGDGMIQIYGSDQADVAIQNAIEIAAGTGAQPGWWFTNRSNLILTSDVTDADFDAEFSLILGSSNTPISLPVDYFAMYGKSVGGRAVPAFATEDLSEILLYPEAAVTTAQGIADALTAQGLLAASTISGYTNEEAQDAIGTILVDSSTIDFTYNDGVPSITASVIPGGISHNSLANLTTGDPHTQYALLAGRVGGQQIFGGTGPGEFLTLYGTDEAQPGQVRIGSDIVLYGPGGTAAGDLHLQCVLDDIGTIYGDSSGEGMIQIYGSNQADTVMQNAIEIAAGTVGSPGWWFTNRSNLMMTSDITDADFDVEFSLVMEASNTPINLPLTYIAMYGKNVGGRSVPAFLTDDLNEILLYPESAVTTAQGIADALTTLGLLETSTIAASGDVTGPGSSTDNAIVRFDGATGKLLQNSTVTLSDTGAYSSSGALNRISLTNTTDAASVQLMILEGDRATVTANDEAYVSLNLSDSAGNQTEAARLTWALSDVTDTTERGRIDFSVSANGTITKFMGMSGTALSPSTNDGLLLGTATLSWSDLYLASGGTINFNNGDLLLTHSADTLTVSGGTFNVVDDAYAAGWNASTAVPTKNALYDKIETLAPLASPTFTGTVTLPATSATGTITLSENTSIALDPAGSADGKYSGITVTGTGGATIAFGDLVTLDKDDSRWELVDISVAAAATGDARGILGIAVTSSTDGNPITVLLHGIVRADAAFPALTIGAPVYASTTGDIVVTQPSTTDHVIRVVGFGLTADELYFNPDNIYFTHT